MDYSFLNLDNNKIILPTNIINAGIYKADENDNFSGKPWGNDYLNNPIEPTSEAYSRQFYAKNHIPSVYRPGNNPKPSIFDFVNTEKLNTQCYKI